MSWFKNRLLIPAAFMALSACAQNSDGAPDTPRPGAIAITGAMCGGILGTTCGTEGDFCKTEVSAQCGASDQSGTCEPIPRICTQQYEPVCGCDGITYGNECSANGKGVSAAYKGECKS